MRISIPCPNIIHKNGKTLGTALETLDASIKVTIGNGLIAFDVEGETLEAQLEAVAALESHVYDAITMTDDAETINALYQLKAAAGLLSQLVRHEDARKTRASESAEATTDTAISHSHAEQHASTDDSSEQHGAAPENEETVNEQAQQEEPGQQYPGFHGTRI